MLKHSCFTCRKTRELSISGMCSRMFWGHSLFTISKQHSFNRALARHWVLCSEFGSLEDPPYSPLWHLLPLTCQGMRAACLHHRSLDPCENTSNWGVLKFSLPLYYKLKKLHKPSIFHNVFLHHSCSKVGRRRGTVTAGTITFLTLKTK